MRATFFLGSLWVCFWVYVPLSSDPPCVHLVGVVTPVASANDGYNTITFNAKGQTATLIYVNSAWMIIALGSTSAFLAAGSGPITA